MKLDEFLKIPWRKQDQPVLRPGSPGSWDDFAAITPSFWHDDQKGLTRMLYTGQQLKSRSWGIGMAVSRDLQRWEKISSDPILQSKTEGNIFNIDGATLLFKDKFNLFFESKCIREKSSLEIRRLLPSGFIKSLITLKMKCRDLFGISMASGHGSGRKIWRLTSDDLLTWDLGLAKIVLEGNQEGWDGMGIFSPRIFFLKDSYYLFYAGYDGAKINTGLAVSQDLEQWNKVLGDPVFQHGEKGSWDENHSLIVDVVELEDGFAGFYEGENHLNRFGIGLAYSKDLLRWQRVADNPVLTTGVAGSFDERMVCSPHLVFQGGCFYLFYSGHNRSMEGCCGLAIAQAHS